jgi:hypothetical protein
MKKVIKNGSDYTNGYEIGFIKGYDLAIKKTLEVLEKTMTKEKDFCFKCKYNKKKICQLPVDNRLKCPMSIALLNAVKI